MKEISVPTCRVTVFVGGDLADARRSLRREFFEGGLCVTCTPATFIFAAGAEEGVEVGLLNYPRFPIAPEELHARAEKVARRLMDDLCQHTALIVGPTETKWLTRRPD